MRFEIGDKVVIISNPPSSWVDDLGGVGTVCSVIRAEELNDRNTLLLSSPKGLAGYWVSSDAVKLLGDKMSDVVTTTKERVLEAAGKCSTAKETLKTLFPDVFKEEWVNITKDVSVKLSDSTSRFAPMVVYHGNIIGDIDKTGMHLHDQYKAEPGVYYWDIYKKA